MTRDQLHSEATRVLESWKGKLLAGADLGMDFYLHRPEDPPGRWRTFPVEPENARILNSGAAKTSMFDAIRGIVKDTNTDAVIWVSDTWKGVTTAAGMAAPREELKRLSRIQGMEEATRRGWIMRVEALMVIAQTEEYAIRIEQEYRRGDLGISLVGSAGVENYPQAQFSGRGKMFGDLRRENLF